MSDIPDFNDLSEEEMYKNLSGLQNAQNLMQVIVTPEDDPDTTIIYTLDVPESAIREIAEDIEPQTKAEWVEALADHPDVDVFASQTLPTKFLRDLEESFQAARDACAADPLDPDEEQPAFGEIPPPPPEVCGDWEPTP